MQLEGYPESVLLDFDLAVEHFDLWFEERANATVEVPAPQKPKQVVHEPKYPTIMDVLGLEGASELALSEEELRLAEMVNSGMMEDPLELLDILEGMGGR